MAGVVQRGQPTRCYVNGPDPAEVKALRLRVQDHYSIGIVAAQMKCGATVRSVRRAWMAWETGERRMHPGLWELAQLRCGTHPDLLLAPRSSART